jgi:hypothetical protein
MAIINSRVDLDRLDAEAREVDFRRVVMTVIVALFFAIGWVVGRLWIGMVWSALAIREGWREGSKRTADVNRGPGRPR